MPSQAALPAAAAEASPGPPGGGPLYFHTAFPSIGGQALRPGTPGARPSALRSRDAVLSPQIASLRRHPAHPSRWLSAILWLAALTAGCSAGEEPSTADELPPTLRVGESAEGTIAKGERHTYSLAVSAGQYLRLRLDQRGIDLAVDLIGPAGETLRQVDGPGGRWIEETLPWIARASGSYRVDVAPRPGEEPAGEYRLVLEELRAAAARDPSRVAAETLYHRARHLRQLPAEEQRREALEALREALDLWSQVEDAEGTAHTLFELGSVHLVLGEPRLALAQYEQALPRYQDAGNLTGQANVLNDMALVFSRLGEVEKAFDHYHRALELWNQLEDELDKAATLAGLGALHYTAGELQRARDLYNQALALYRAAGEPRREATTLSSLGIVHRMLGDTDEARRCYERALEIARGTENHSLEVVVLLNLGSLHKTQGELQLALAHYTGALRLARELGDARGERTVLSFLGLIYRELDEPEKALEYLEPALDLARQAEAPGDEAQTAMSIGWVYDDLRQPEAALEHFDLALARSREAQARRTELYTLLGIGRCQRRMGQLAAAQETLRRALDLQRDLGYGIAEIDILRETGKIQLALRQTAAARATLHHALERSRALESPPREALIRASLARAHRDLGDLTAARAEIERALAIHASLRTKVASPELRASFRSRRYEDHELYIDLLMTLHRRHPEQGLAAAALAASETARARGLVELLAEAGVDVRGGIDPELKQQERDSGRRLSWVQGNLVRELAKKQRHADRVAELRRQLAAVRRQREQLEWEIRRRHSRYADIHYPQPLGLDGIRELLDERTALLEYALGSERSFLFVVTRERFEVHELAPAAEIGELVQRLRGASARSGRRLAGRLRQTASQLYDRLIAPAATALADVDRLLIAPDRELYYLPFEALLGESQAYLLDRWAVAYVPSATVLAGLRQQPASAAAGRRARFVGFGDPFYPDASYPGVATEAGEPLATRESLAIDGQDPTGRGWRWRPLPASGEEVRAISQLYPADDVAIYLGTAAREDNVKNNPRLSGSRRVHFASHGMLDDRDPAYSGLLLSLDPESEEDGLLQVHEIFNLSLAADLVVLSACDTGLGKQVRGEGILGMSRAFLYAGASGLVVSLWQVADTSTAELMVRFYRHLEAGDDTIDALRAAKLELSEDAAYAHPFHWAPFILVGNP